MSTNGSALPPHPPQGTSEGGGRYRLGSVVAAIQNHVDAIELPAWPVYGLTDDDRLGWLSGVGESSESGIEELRLSYRPPDEAERLVVHSQRRGTPTVDLARLLSWVQHGDDDDYPSGGENVAHQSIDTVTEAPRDAEATINGTTVSATRWQTETTTAWRAHTEHATISVAARVVRLDTLNLIEITDLRPYQQRRATLVATYLAARNQPRRPID